MSITEYIDFIVKKYGEGNQIIIALEEMAEPQKELTKCLRGKLNREHLLEEISDVHLMLWQLQKIFGFSDAEILQVVDEKITRTLNL